MVATIGQCVNLGDMQYHWLILSIRLAQLFSRSCSPFWRASIYPISTSTKYDSMCSFSPLFYYVVHFKTCGHFSFWFSFTTRSVREGQFYFYFLFMNVPCSNCWWAEWVYKLRLVIEKPSHTTYDSHNFLQDLLHLLVCCKQVDTIFLLLNIGTVDTSQHWSHLKFNKVILIHDHYPILPHVCQMMSHGKC